MKRRTFWEIGGFIAGGVLILFGIVAIFMGVNGFNTTRDAIKGEGITFGSADDPAVAKHADQWAGEQVTTETRRAHSRRSCASTRSRERRPDVRGDGPLPVRGEARRPGRHKR